MRTTCRGLPRNTCQAPHKQSSTSTPDPAHNDKEVNSLMEMWWKELNTWVQRDQLSLCYVAWKMKFKIGFISENPRFKNDYFKWCPHKENDKRLFYRLIRKLKFYCRLILIYPIFVFKIGIIGKAFFNKPV